MPRPHTVITITTRLSDPAYIMLLHLSLKRHESIAYYLRGAIDLYVKETIGEWVIPATEEQRYSYAIKHDSELISNSPLRNVSVRLTQETLTNLDRVCAYHYRGRSWALRACIMYRLRSEYPFYDTWIQGGAHEAAIMD